MAINFPNSPSLNDTHTVNGVIYTWDGTAWVTSSGVDTFELVQDLTPMLGGDLDGNSKNIRNVGVLTTGNVTVGGATTDLIVSGNARVTGILSVGTGTVVIDETTVKTGTSNLHSVGIEIAGVNVLGADTPIGVGATIYNTGGAVFTGIVTAASLVGTLPAENLSGVISDDRFPSALPAVSAANLTNIPTSNLSGIIPNACFPSVLPAIDGSALTGIQGLATPLGNTSPLNKFLKTPKTINIGAGTSLTIESDAASGNVAFVKEGTIHVSVGGTFRVKQNTKLRLDVLGIF